MTTNDPTLNPLHHLLPEDEVPVLMQTLRRIEIAEQEIARAKREYPLLETQLHESFRTLRPTPPLSRVGDVVYRLHCRELLRRVAGGLELGPGTDAELLAVLSEASLCAPPDRAAVYLYSQLFERSFPRQAQELRASTGPVLADDYDRRQAHELELTLRRKLSTSRELA